MIQTGIGHHEHIHHQISDVIRVIQQHVEQKRMDKYVRHIIDVVLHQ